MIGLFVVIATLNIYFIAHYLRETAKAIRELSGLIKHEGLKQNIALINLCSAIENKKQNK